MRAGDQVAAAGAGVRVAMHLIFDTALMAPVRAWLARAEQLLEGLGETSAHAWLAVVRAYERMLTGDLATAGQWAGLPSRWVRGVTLGVRHRRGGTSPAAHPAWRCPARSGAARAGRGGHRLRGPRSAVDRDRLLRARAPCRASPSMTWPRSGPRRWSGGARRTPSGACTALPSPSR